MSKGKWLILVTLCLSSISGLWIDYAQAGIVLKVVAVNPSQTKTQTTLLKAYLPREAKPKDVVELGDLETDYDVEKELYYVYKKFELVPGESVSRSVEIKDVWIISNTDLEALTTRTKELVKALRRTIYFDTAVVLQDELKEKSDKILRTQEQAMSALPQTHIAVYRDNVRIFNSMREILGKLENMLVETKIGSGTTRKISVESTWRVILGVVLALGFLSSVFFVIWHKQAGIAVLEQKEKTPLEDIEDTDSPY